MFTGVSQLIKELCGHMVALVVMLQEVNTPENFESIVYISGVTVGSGGSRMPYN